MRVRARRLRGLPFSGKVPGTFPERSRNLPGAFPEHVCPISADPDKARRQLQNLAPTNTRLAARLERGELPGYKAPGEPPPPISAPPSDSPAPAPAAPSRDAGPLSRAGAGPIIEEVAYDTPQPQPTPSAEPSAETPELAGDPEASPETPEPEGEPSGGLWGNFRDGFAGRV